jgi:hypothetical protein
MPLIKSSSKKAFQKNVETEMSANPGKANRAQNLAIAYATQRRSKSPKKMASGGQVTDNYQSPCTESCTSPCTIHEQSNLDLDHKSAAAKSVLAAMREDERGMGQHGAEEEGPQGTWMKDGGQITDNYSDTEDDDGEDMIGRIMAQRQEMYSEGGKVSNRTDDEDLAGFEHNDFDVLGSDDDLEFEDTAANSGDELGNKQEDEDRADKIMRKMLASRKQTNPKPA